MDTRQLKYFEAVCRFGNLSHAADACNVAPSAVSHHISNLEIELETSLFIRKSRGMTPTAAGLVLLEHAIKILELMDTAITEVKYGRLDIYGSLVVGMPYSVIKVIGAELMRRILDEYPKVKLLIKEGLSSVNYAALSLDQLDLTIAFNPPVDGTTDRIALLEEELFCIGHSSIIGKSKLPMQFDEIPDLPVVLLQSGVLSRALLDKPAALARLEDKCLVQLASVAATQCALSEKIGCTLAPKMIAMELLASGTVSARPVINPKPLRTLYLITPHRAPTILREAMSELIVELIKNAVREGRWDSATLI